MNHTPDHTLHGVECMNARGFCDSAPRAVVLARGAAVRAALRVSLQRGHGLVTGQRFGCWSLLCAAHTGVPGRVYTEKRPRAGVARVDEVMGYRVRTLFFLRCCGCLQLNSTGLHVQWHNHTWT